MKVLILEVACCLAAPDENEILADLRMNNRTDDRHTLDMEYMIFFV